MLFDAQAGCAECRGKVSNLPVSITTSVYNGTAVCSLSCIPRGESALMTPTLLSSFFSTLRLAGAPTLIVLRNYQVHYTHRESVTILGYVKA